MKDSTGICSAAEGLLPGRRCGRLSVSDNSPTLRLLQPKHHPRADAAAKPRWRCLLCNTDLTNADAARASRALVLGRCRVLSPWQSASSYSLTLAAVGRTFPHDVESHALRQWILTLFVLLAHAQAQAARHFSPKPSQPFQFAETSHRPRSQPQAFKLACLLREREEKQLESKAAPTPPPPPHTPPQFAIPYLTCCSRPVCIALPTLITRTL